MKKLLIIWVLLTLTACGDNGSIPPDVVGSEYNPSIALTAFNVNLVGTSTTDIKISLSAELYNDGDVDLNDLHYEFSGLSCDDRWLKPDWQEMVMMQGNFIIHVEEYYHTTPSNSTDFIYVYNNCGQYGMGPGTYEVYFTLYNSGGQFMANWTNTFTIEPS